MEQTKLNKLFGGREQYAAKFDMNEFTKFMYGISNEFDEWKIIVEGDLVSNSSELASFISKLKPKDTILLIDQKNKIINFMSRELYNLNSVE